MHLPETQLPHPSLGLTLAVQVLIFTDWGTDPALGAKTHQDPAYTEFHVEKIEETGQYVQRNRGMTRSQTGSY